MTEPKPNPDNCRLCRFSETRCYRGWYGTICKHQENVNKEEFDPKAGVPAWCPLRRKERSS